MRASRFAIPAGDAALAAVAIATAWAAKAFYSNAGFDALRWILTPTVGLVTWAAGVPFELEPHHGYLSRDQLFLVAPACAGRSCSGARPRPTPPPCSRTPRG